MRTVEIVTAAGALAGTAASLIALRSGKRKRGLSPIQRWRNARAAPSPKSDPE